jgi:hypothetical protein
MYITPESASLAVSALKVQCGQLCDEFEVSLVGLGLARG